MDDFRKFHAKALIFILGGILLILLGCWAAAAVGLWWIVLFLLPGGCFGIRIAYHIQLRRYQDRHNRG